MEIRGCRSTSATVQEVLSWLHSCQSTEKLKAESEVIVPGWFCAEGGIGKYSFTPLSPLWLWSSTAIHSVSALDKWYLVTCRNKRLLELSFMSGQLNSGQESCTHAQPQFKGDYSGFSNVIATLPGFTAGTVHVWEIKAALCIHTCKGNRLRPGNDAQLLPAPALAPLLLGCTPAFARRQPSGAAKGGRWSLPGEVPPGSVWWLTRHSLLLHLAGRRPIRRDIIFCGIMYEGIRACCWAPVPVAALPVTITTTIAWLQQSRGLWLWCALSHQESLCTGSIAPGATLWGTGSLANWHCMWQALEGTKEAPSRSLQVSLGCSTSSPAHQTEQEEWWPSSLICRF